MTMPYDPYVDPYISPPQITPPGSMGTPLGGAARAQPNIPRNIWEKLAAALIIAGGLRGGKPRPIHQLAAGYLGGMGQKRQQAHGEWRQGEAQREADAQRQRAFLLSQQSEQKRDIREDLQARATERRAQEYKAAEEERLVGRFRGAMDELGGTLSPEARSLMSLGAIGGVDVPASQYPARVSAEDQAKEAVIKALEAKGDPNSMAMATAARLGWTPPTSIQEMGAGLPVAEEREAELAGTLATTARTEGLTKAEAEMLPLEKAQTLAQTAASYASAGASGRSGRGGGEKEETARTRQLRLSGLRNDRGKTIAMLEGGTAMIENFETGEKEPVHYDKVRDPATIRELKADLKWLNSEIATATGRGTPLVPTRPGTSRVGWGKDFRIIEQRFGKNVADALRDFRNKDKFTDEQIIAQMKTSRDVRLRNFVKNW